MKIAFTALTFALALFPFGSSYADEEEGSPPTESSPPLDSQIWIGGAKVTVDESMIPVDPPQEGDTEPSP